MSKAFAVLALAFSALMLLMNVTNLDTAKPAVMLFWLLIGAVSIYKLAKKPPQES
jgi:FtsH-binding integral membrane protein